MCVGCCSSCAMCATRTKLPPTNNRRLAFSHSACSHWAWWHTKSFTSNATCTTCTTLRVPSGHWYRATIYLVMVLHYYGGSLLLKSQIQVNSVAPLRIRDCFVLKALVRLPREVDLFGVEEYWIVTFCKLKQFSSWVPKNYLCIWGHLDNIN